MPTVNSSVLEKLEKSLMKKNMCKIIWIFQMAGTTPFSELLMKIKDLLVLGAHRTYFIVFGKQFQCWRTTTRFFGIQYLIYIQTLRTVYFSGARRFFKSPWMTMLNLPLAGWFDSIKKKGNCSINNSFLFLYGTFIFCLIVLVYA